eukprot:Phypoly_transcript_20999.p2 GENE.Phypoly_transcript_20999~~Phypoly_transcript_20999.p2  ORF type:complete len:135 (+),score=21.45 Phypoly_transcript_20999:35-406(+)
MKANNKHKFMMCRVTSEGEIVLTAVGPPSATFKDLQNALPTNECRFVVYFLPVNNENKLLFIAWWPDIAKIKDKMFTVAAKHKVKSTFIGLQYEIGATDLYELDEIDIMQRFIRSFSYGPQHA